MRHQNTPLLAGLTLVLSSSVWALSDDEAARLETMLDMGMNDLAEVEFKLDDVFDVFDGIVKAESVRVASGVRQSSNVAPAATTVITARDIEAMGARDLDEILESVPGLHVSRNTIYGPLYVMRGVYSDLNPEVLVLVNGIPMKRLQSGDRSVAWGGMPIHAIERIEVIRGPGSALYGADAFAGVIDIRTKSASDIGGSEVGIRAGSFSTVDGWLLHGDRWGTVDVALMLETYSTDGHEEIIQVDAQSHEDSRDGTQASHAPGAPALAQKGVDLRLELARQEWKLRAAYQGRYDLGMGNGIANVLDPEGSMNDARISADLSYHSQDWHPNWEVDALLSYADLQADIYTLLYPRGSFGGYYPDGVINDISTDERQLRLSTQASYSGWRNHLLRLGTGYSWEELYHTRFAANLGMDADGNPIPPGSPVIDLTDTAAAMYPEAVRKNWHVFVQDTWSFAPDWEFTAGLRHDDYSDFGSTTNPRFALVWQTTPRLTSKLLYGKAFRAPSFTELYLRNNLVLAGNPEVQAETLENWELAFNWRAAKDMNLTVNLFRFTIEDKIQFADAAGADPATNSGRNKGQGAELELRWKFSAQAAVLLNYAYTRVQAYAYNNYSDGTDLGFFPQQQVYLRVDWLLRQNWFMDARINHVRDRARFADMGGREPIADYTTVDLSLRWKTLNNKAWNFSLGVRNLFDAEVREPAYGMTPNDLPQAGRHWFVETRYRF